MKRNNIIIIISIGLVICCTGCRTSKDFKYIENSIRQEIHPAKMDKVFRFGTGFISGPLLKCFVRDKQAKEFMKGFKKAQIGIYEISHADKYDSLEIPRNVEKCLAEEGWEPFMYIRSKDGDNLSFYFKVLSKKTAGVYGLIMEPDGLVILEAEIKLKKILKKFQRNQYAAIVDHL